MVTYLADKLTIVTGPPGSGKTQNIVDEATG